VVVDTWTNKLYSTECAGYSTEKLGIHVDDPWARKWLRNDKEGKDWAKEMGLTKHPYIINEDNVCLITDPRPLLEFGSPADETTVATSPLDIYVRVDATSGFDSARLEYGPGKEPVQWELLKNIEDPITSMTELMSWDISDLPSGWVTLRLYMSSTGGGYAERSVQVNIQVPTPTPTPTPSATPTSTPSPTPTTTQTPAPSSTATVTPSATPSATPTP
jgi:hypothetical protein